MRSLYFRKENI